MTTKKSEWNLSIYEKNRFSLFNPNGLFVICKYCERSGNSVNKDVGRINMRRPFIGANIDKWSDHASTRMHRLSFDKWSKMVDKGIDPEKSKRKADTLIKRINQLNCKNHIKNSLKKLHYTTEGATGFFLCIKSLIVMRVTNGNEMQKFR